MPTNPQLSYMQCYANIDKILRKNIPDGGLILDDLLIDVLIKFPVTETSVKKFIKKYEATGRIIVKDGVIFKGGEE